MDWEEPEFASEMEIIVRSGAVRRYVLIVDGGNTVEDALVEILGSDRAGRRPEPRLYFDGSALEMQKTLADCGIKLGSVLHLMCTPRVSAYAADDPIEIAKTDCAESSSPVRSDGDEEMKIFVQSNYHGNYALEVDSSNTIWDVLLAVLSIERLMATPKPKLYFNGRLLEAAKSLADYSIQDGFILQLECSKRVGRAANEREWPNLISGRKRIIIADRSSEPWEKEYDKILLGLLIEQIRNGGRNILYGGKNSWSDIVTKFNESTGLNYEYKHLYMHFDFYALQYQIVNRIKHHPKFSWDHQRQVVITTDAEWNEYVKGDPDAAPYRRRRVPYIDLLEIVFAEEKE